MARHNAVVLRLVLRPCGFFHVHSFHSAPSQGKPLHVASETADLFQLLDHQGLSQELLEQLLAKHVPPQGFIAPSLNLEVSAALFDSGRKRDGHFLANQNIVGHAAALIASAIGHCRPQRPGLE